MSPLTDTPELSHQTQTHLDINPIDQYSSQAKTKQNRYNYKRYFYETFTPLTLVIQKPK